MMKIADKEITLFQSKKADAPLVVLHTVHGEGEEVYHALKALTDIDVSFVAIGDINWNDEMSPWEAPSTLKGEEVFTGGADAYLQKLTREIVPKLLEMLPKKPSYLALAGYSLAGLFAVYSLYQTDMFSRTASASGSFWYPDFLAYIMSHKMLKNPEKMYFSLGDKEARTRNPILKKVQENTALLADYYAGENIRTTFEMNPGNHFQDAVGRMAKGICWMLED